MPNWTETAPALEVACPLGCGDGERRQIVDTVWEAPEAAVYQCTNCEVVFLHPIMSEEEERGFYEEIFAGYMKERGSPGETKPEEHFESFQGEARRRLANLEPHLRPDMDVLEVGSSTGFLLDAVRPHVASVQGVEPGELYRDYANGRDIPTVADLAEVEDRQFDLVLAYYVVEHLRDPVGDLGRWLAMLRPGGKLAVEVPNVDDALVRYYQVDAFDRFYWQKAHYFNYSWRTMELVMRRAGFAEVETIPEQRYDISNHVHWMLTGKPGGKGKYVDVFDDRLNAEYARCLRDHWYCDTVFAVATKSG
ncbi:MAG: class I SAM-dependent methyltransferase [Thermoleophilaceae bacterium]